MPDHIEKKSTILNRICFLLIKSFCSSKGRTKQSTGVEVLAFFHLTKQVSSPAPYPVPQALPEMIPKHNPRSKSSSQPGVAQTPPHISKTNK